MSDIDSVLVLNNRATWLDSLGYQNAASDIRRGVAEIERLREENGHQHDEISRLDKEIDRLRRDAEPGDGQWKMAVAEERERCAKEADYYAKHSKIAKQVAAAIRERKDAS